MATVPVPVPVPGPGGRGQQHVQDLDDLFRCGICFDYFNIAMIIPQCSHNYCSLCIRKFLSYKTQCPTCCVAVTESDLRNNRILDDLVKTFYLARQHLSQFSLISPPTPPQNLSKGKLDATASQGCTGKQIKQENKLMDTFLVKTSTPTSKRTAVASRNAPSMSTETLKEECVEIPCSEKDACGPATPSTSTMKVQVKVECPVCGVGISEQYINKHLDSCLTSDEKKESLRSSVNKRKPMAKVVYNLLSDRDLRKRLKEVGLSTHGSKQQMIKRHQEFVHMYNAQCDSLNPKSASEIVSEIVNNEKIRSSLEAKQESGMTFSKDQTEEEIDEIHQQYRKKHKNEFQHLIESMKGRWGKKGGKQIKKEPSEDCKNNGGKCQSE
ncbi:E3 ubiquitin-protein ligase RAD18 [Spea bombifrons]|uniref:E3 ubiquitin-protein ligase RAD18 n=1 Tax=Spea bombifrons TaxID=233779 RepID=UPI00234B833E|nr:E3 ubiquitin-protein ligase RAD18 [Spea bombifrons]